jgi:tRNA-dihydrouridine synthase B
VARAARKGSGLPVTVKLRSGAGPDDRSGVRLARRLVDEAGVAGIAFHPRHAAQHHRGTPDYALAAELVRTLPVPVLISGGLRDADGVRRVYRETGAAAVLLARGSLGNPWLFAQVLGLRARAPTADEILAELDWVMDRAVEHFGPERASRYLRKFYPWYVERLGASKALQQRLMVAATVDEARSELAVLRLPQAA